MSHRVLVIDDEANIRRVVRLTLEAAGYEVGEAGDGERGLEVFANGTTWDAVLLDQKMPGMDGLETLRRIKECQAGARVIMVTAFASIELAVDAMKLGATDFIRKPMTPETVRNAVQFAIAKRETPAAVPAGTEVETEADQPARPRIDRMTLNGFHFLHASEAGDDWPGPENERRFVVTDPHAGIFRVTVLIDEESIGYVERMIRRRIPAENSFWTRRAERTLAEYLWAEGRTPPLGRLALGPIDREQLAVAERWTGD